MRSWILAIHLLQDPSPKDGTTHIQGGSSCLTPTSLGASLQTDTPRGWSPRCSYVPSSWQSRLTATCALFHFKISSKIITALSTPRVMTELLHSLESCTHFGHFQSQFFMGSIAALSAPTHYRQSQLIFSWPLCSSSTLHLCKSFFSCHL